MSSDLIFSSYPTGQKGENKSYILKKYIQTVPEGKKPLIFYFTNCVYKHGIAMKNHEIVLSTGFPALKFKLVKLKSK